MQDYTIDKVAWHTSVKGNPETAEHINLRFWIRQSDLSPIGQQLIRRTYDRWLRSIDRGARITGRLLKKELSKLTSNE